MIVKPSVPECIARLLWDVKKDEVDVNRHARFLIRRVLEFGDAISLNWIRKTYSEEVIKEVVKAKRGLDRKTLAFWTLYYGLPAEGGRDV
jgi:hypothetical protein